MKQATDPGRRLSKDARREQLLDVAADLIVDRGWGALTMEGLAASAGVSKALPYRHFANAEAVVTALYQRETARFGQRVLAAIADETDPDAIVRAAIHEYLDVVGERGRILDMFYGPGSPIPDVTRDGTRASLVFTAGVLERAFGLRGQTGTVLAGITLGVLYSAVDMWSNRVAPRAMVEDVAIRAVTAAARSVSDANVS